MAEKGPPAKSRELALFLAKDPDTVEAVTAIIEAVVAHGKYRIPPEERQDIVQQSLTHLWVQVLDPDFRLRKTLACAAAFTAQCRCVDWWRRRHPTEAIPPGLPDPARRPDETTDDNERRRLATLIKERLSPACRSLLDWIFGQELSYADVASRTGRKPGTLRGEMFTCIKKAREIHDELTGGGPGRKRGHR
jgi:RNA polymerase sigma factor (sigma-70 family)